MKQFITPLSLLFLAIPSCYAQINSSAAVSAYERTAYEKWDDFAPWWYFTFFNSSYDDEDRRTIYARVGTMTLWSIYADEYEMLERSTDSVLKQETYKALDKTLNKSWFIFQKSRARKLYDNINEKINTISTLPDGAALSTLLSKKHLNILNSIEYLKDAYAPDADKYPLIEAQIKELTKLNSLTESVYAFLSKIQNPSLEPQYYDIPMDELKLNIQNLIKN